MEQNNDLKPPKKGFITKVYPTAIRIKNHANANPKLTVLILFLTMLTSLVILFFWSNKESNEKIETAINNASKTSNDDFFNDLGSKAEFSMSSIGDMYKMQKLQDTLDYLMSKGENLTKEDKLTFVRVMEQFVSIDTVSQKYINTEYLKQQIENEVSQSNDSFMNAYPLNKK